MRYAGSKCEKCGEIFTEQNEVVVCPRCGTPEHKNCWEEAEVCVNKEKHEAGYVWQKNAPSSPSPPFNPVVINENQTRGTGRPCSNCGSINDPAEPNCINCGQRLYLNPNVGGNNYAGGGVPPFGQADPNMAIDGIPATEVAAYVQQNADAYIAKFLQMDNRGTKNGFNWAAALFPYLWLFYRKMYKLGFLVIVAFLAIGLMGYSKAGLENAKASTAILESAMNNEISFEQALEELEKIPAIERTALSFIGYFLQLALSIFIGIKADSFYRKKVVEDILKTREEAHDSSTYFYLLAKKGGCSAGAAIGSFFIYIFATFIIEAVLVSLIS